MATIDNKLARWIAVMTLLSMLSGIAGWGISKVATKHNVAMVRNSMSADMTGMHITLLYVKYDNAPINTWDQQDQELYQGLVELKRSLKKERNELSGIPSRLPE